MARMAPHEYEALSREERLRRIGALFYKAVVISLARKQALAGETGGDISSQAGEDSVHETNTLEAASLSDEDLAILRRYAGLGEIAPREATEFWGVCRTTAYRRLLSLEQGGWIVRHGATTATRYTITKKARVLLEQDEQAKQARDDSRASM
jgi:DNA-binding MarR family transcriptional regulator